jgi:hypothetical protein
MSVIRKKPNQEHWVKKSLSFSAEEIAAINSGSVEKIIVMTPNMRVFCEIVCFDTILTTVVCKGEYYVVRFKKEDAIYPSY